MNANPFTLGHRALVEKAAKRCDHLLVFVVEEDASVFPFQLRLRLVREGVADLAAAPAKVSVLPGGPYMVTRASFPAYFTGEADHARVHAALDATIFAEKIAPVFGIDRRFVGSEPYCAVTSAYNDTLLAVLPPRGVRVEIMERASTCASGLPEKKIMAEEGGGADIQTSAANPASNSAPESPEYRGAGQTCPAEAQAADSGTASTGGNACEAISASRVRALMREADYAEHPERFAGLLASSTLKAVIGPEGREAARKLRERGESRH